jgi:SAM-dependent methyltransferase
VLRPIAEQVMRALEVRAGQTVLDIVCDAGALTRELAVAVHGGVVFAADVDPDLAACAAGDLGAARSCVIDSVRVLLPDGACDRVGSLLTLGFAPRVLADARRVLRADGRAALAIWDPEQPPAHELALLEALRAETAQGSPYLEAALSWPLDTTGWRVERIHDVVRFDGAAHFWAAAVIERPLLAEFEGRASAVAAAVRSNALSRLSRFAAHDGSLRIPVHALLLR